MGLRGIEPSSSLPGLAPIVHYTYMQTSECMCLATLEPPLFLEYESRHAVSDVQITFPSLFQSFTRVDALARARLPKMRSLHPATLRPERG